MTGVTPMKRKTVCECGNEITIEIEGVLRSHGQISLTCKSCKKINSMTLL